MLFKLTKSPVGAFLRLVLKKHSTLSLILLYFLAKDFLPELFINFRHEMFKYPKTQETAEKIDAGNSELFSNQIFRGRLCFADNWAS
ncbi:hypothetical protein [Anaerophaga thermohalophila]|jgi:hypothetical protein|uniref:hypothetical protein n=1 Tax=Anaerophaga thermohalophila TaxID=177400 RepID=UPI00036240E9|nr:hypothetical protein [Anaerophaga thermohalophila]